MISLSEIVMIKIVPQRLDFRLSLGRVFSAQPLAPLRSNTITLWLRWADVAHHIRRLCMEFAVAHGERSI
jgi:hypothetical protein